MIIHHWLISGPSGTGKTKVLHVITALLAGEGIHILPMHVRKI
jgi:ABC-type lipoprotein export system ATPase subunit